MLFRWHPKIIAALCLASTIFLVFTALSPALGTLAKPLAGVNTFGAKHVVTHGGGNKGGGTDAYLTTPDSPWG